MRIAGSLALLSLMLGEASAGGPPTAEDQITVAAFVIPRGQMHPASRTTLQLTLESTLKQDSRLDVRDRDLQLLETAGERPSELIGEARGLLRTGEQLLAQGRADEAMSRLSAAQSQLRQVLPYIRSRELARAQFLVGATYAVLGRTDEAIASFVRLRTWRPDYKVDSNIAPQKLLPLWGRAAERVEQLPTGTLKLKSRPDGAAAYVDGRFVGFTPTSASNLAVGTHYVTVRAEGHRRDVQHVVIEPDTSVRITAHLPDSPGSLDLEQTLDTIDPRLGDSRLTEPMTQLHHHLGVDHALFALLDQRTGELQGYVYDLRTGRRLASAKVTMGPEDDPQKVFARLADGLYTQIFTMPDPDTPPGLISKSTTSHKSSSSKPPLYRRWWFWAGVGAVATIVLVPIMFSDDGGNGPSCPAGHTCGDVVFRF